MFDVNRIKQLRTVAKNPAESDYVQALVTILVELEHRQLEAVEDLHDALDVDTLDVDSTREKRKDTLLEVADAAASGEFSDFWFEEVIAEHVTDAEEARPYAGLSDEEWSEQIETWADSYRSRAPDEFAGDSDREIARQHVSRKFGVSLNEFEREVVDYEMRDALQTLLAGNFTAVEQGIETATAEIEAGEEDAV